MELSFPSLEYALQLSWPASDEWNMDMGKIYLYSGEILQTLPYQVIWVNNASDK